MEIQGVSRALLLFSLIFTSVVHAAANDPITQIGALPICAQACIATSFSICSCTLLDFNCGCICNTFSSSIQSCIQDSCSPSFLQPALDIISQTCPKPTTSSKGTSTSQTSTRTTLKDLTTTASSFSTTSFTDPPPVTTTPTGTTTGPTYYNWTSTGPTSACIYQTASGIRLQTSCMTHVPMNAASNTRIDNVFMLFVWIIGVISALVI